MRLILNADDLGYSPGVNQAILGLEDSGLLTSSSLVVNLAHSAAAIEEVRRRPHMAVGVHLNLTKGRPCLPPEQVPSLVGLDGRFHPTPRMFARGAAGLIRWRQAHGECRAQIERALEAGITVSHLDSHSHWHVLPGLRGLVDRLAAEYGVGLVRPGDPRRALLPNGAWLAGGITRKRRPAEKGSARSDYILSLHQWLSPNGDPSLLTEDSRLRRLLGAPNLTLELVTHPGSLPDPDFPADTLGVDRRANEVAFLRSETYLRWVGRLGATVANGRHGA